MTEWIYDEVPIHMGSGTYFVAVTKAGLRFIAWIEDGAFVTRENGRLYILDVKCWLPLPTVKMD